MPEIALGLTISRRFLAGALTFPNVSVVNFVVEKTNTNQVDQKSWVSRPGLLSKYATVGGLLRGIYDCPIGFLASPEVFFQVSGGGFYSQSFAPGTPTFIGAIAGTNNVIFASTPDVMLICGGLNVYRYDGTLTTIAMPNGEQVIWVAYMSGYFLLGVADSQVIYFMVPGAAAPDALDFFSAEVQGDNTVRGMVLGDQLVIFSERHTEFWQASGDADLPFNRVVGQLYSKGLAGTNACAVLDNSIYFIGSDRCIYRADTQPVNVGDATISEALRRTADLSGAFCWSFLVDDHAYLVMTLNSTSGTYVLDVSSGFWSQWTSFNDVITTFPWAAIVGFQFKDASILGGGFYQNEIWDISPNYKTDDASNIPGLLTGGTPILGKPQRCDSVTLIMNAGFPAADSTVSLQCSDDQGRTYGTAIPITVASGALTNDYTMNPVWRQLGLMRQPGRVFQFLFEDAGPFRVSTARFNEAFVY